MKPAYGIVVDGSCIGNPGTIEWQGFDLSTGKRVFCSDKFENGTNNISETLAVVHALATLDSKGLDSIVYTDSQTAISWVKHGKFNTTLKGNPEIDKLISRAEKWLREHPQHNKVEYWRTREWGESPADYGRK